MPKRDQQHEAKEATGNNNPKKTTEHARPAHTHNEALTHHADSRAREEDREHRSGSDSNAHKQRKDSHVHEHDHQKEPHGSAPVSENFDLDLRPHSEAGENHGLSGPSEKVGPTAHDIKPLHATLADLTNDELKEILIIPEGQRLEQGAKYIDLAHLEQGEFVARADMLAEQGHYYVPKKETNYVLWNRLNQVDNPTRLDEAE